jgi:hypothetical protein
MEWSPALFEFTFRSTSAGTDRLFPANGAAFTDSGGGGAWNVTAFRRGTDARSIPRIRIPGEHTRDHSVLVGKLAEILRDQRPTRKVAAMFIDMAFGSPIYERLRKLEFNNMFETNFGLVLTPDRTKANMRAYNVGQAEGLAASRRHRDR